MFPGVENVYLITTFYNLIAFMIVLEIAKQEAQVLRIATITNSESIFVIDQFLKRNSFQ